MTSRSSERVQFLRDILCTLAEGGLSFGCGEFVSRTTTKPTDDPDWEYDTVTAWYPDADDTGRHTHTLNIEHIATALNNTAGAKTEEARKLLHIGEGWHKRIAEANRQNDAGAIDAIDASNLAEIAVFGKVIYG